MPDSWIEERAEWISLRSLDRVESHTGKNGKRNKSTSETSPSHRATKAADHRCPCLSPSLARPKQASLSVRQLALSTQALQFHLLGVAVNENQLLERPEGEIITSRISIICTPTPAIDLTYGKGRDSPISLRILSVTFRLELMKTVLAGISPAPVGLDLDSEPTRLSENLDDILAKRRGLGPECVVWLGRGGVCTPGSKEGGEDVLLRLNDVDFFKLRKRPKPSRGLRVRMVEFSSVDVESVAGDC